MTTTAIHAATLGDVSQALKALHLQLLRYQADQSGFNGTPLQFFDRATKDSAFAWLKPLRAAIVTLDARQADGEPISEAEQKELRLHVSDLLDAKTGVLRAKLNAALQADPETALAVSKTRQSLQAMHSA